jgi:2'-5' RNA ligase
MTTPDSVAPGERLRLFLALRLPGDALDEIESWQAAELEGRPRGELRIVPREHLHVTLAFLGHRPVAELPAIVDALRGAARLDGDYRLRPARYRETRSVAMVVLDDVGGAATTLAADLQERLEALDVYRRESRPWLPHITVARFRERPRLQPAALRLRTDVLIPSDAAAYLSRPSPSGARYEVVTPFALGG